MHARNTLESCTYPRLQSPNGRYRERLDVARLMKTNEQHGSPAKNSAFSFKRSVFSTALTKPVLKQHIMQTKTQLDIY